MAESEQIRRDVDNSGPRDELDFWKRRVTRFNYIVDQIKSAHVKATLNVLNVSKSKILKVNYSFIHLSYFQVIKILIMQKHAIISLI